MNTRNRTRNPGGSTRKLTTIRLTETIGSLTNGTIYVVQVSAKNINGYGDPSVEDTWHAQARSERRLAYYRRRQHSITQTAATATVTIDNQTDDEPDGAPALPCQFIVRGVDHSCASIDNRRSAKEFPQFKGLKSDTEYRVEASLRQRNFNQWLCIFKTFTTKRPTVSSVEIDENTITQAGATATVTHTWSPTARQQTVRLKLSPIHTQDDWSTTAYRRRRDTLPHYARCCSRCADFRS